MAKEIKIHLRNPHAKQRKFLDSKAKRRIIRAGRRGGKTVGMAIYGVEMFLAGRRILYAAPTQDQVATFWFEVCEALREAVDAGVFVKNETNHTIELAHTKQRIRAKTAWNADTLRGDYADVLILDEFQLMSEDTWDTVGAPMLLDNDGDAIFIYTPPSLRSSGVSKARDPRHAARLFKQAQSDDSGRWAAFHFTSHDNPYISKEALDEIRSDMTATAYRQEILAEDVDEAPGALWKRELIEMHRVATAPAFDRVVIGVDPSTTSGGDECGIIAGGKAGDTYYVIGDHTLQGPPIVWAQKAIAAFGLHEANHVVYETNQGGEMVAQTLKTAGNVPMRGVHASRGKAVRAEPISVLTENGKVKFVGDFPQLENELCTWEPGSANSPNRLDAFVWVITELSTHAVGAARLYH